MNSIAAYTLAGSFQAGSAGACSEKAGAGPAGCPHRWLHDEAFFKTGTSLE
jgi:hypothetical protein